MREISIRELGYNILLRWKVFVIITLCCIIALMAYQMRENNSEATVQEMNESFFSEEELQQVKECYDSYVNYENAVDYRDNAIVMNIDPYHVNTVVKEYLITCENYEDLQAVADSYVYFVSSGAVGKNIGKDDLDITSLVTANIGESKELTISEEFSCKTIVMVETIHKSVDEAESLANDVETQIMEYSKELGQKVGSHKIECIMQESVVKSHNTLINWQSQMRLAASNEKTNYETKKNSLTALQSEYFNMHYLGNGSDVEIQPSTSTSRITMKIIVLDVVGSIFLAILICMLFYILGGKVHYTYGIQQVYGLRMLGVIPSFLETEKDPVRKSALRKLYHINKQNEAENIDILCNNIKYFANKQQIQKVYLDVSQNMDTAPIEHLVQLLNKENIVCVLSNSFDNDNDKIEAFRKIKNIIIVKESGKSTYKNLENELRLYKENDVNILGVLLIV